jgi:hypothetical protein
MCGATISVFIIINRATWFEMTYCQIAMSTATSNKDVDSTALPVIVL